MVGTFRAWKVRGKGELVVVEHIVVGLPVRVSVDGLDALGAIETGELRSLLCAIFLLVEGE
jgi:hypothetical protein